MTKTKFLSILILLQRSLLNCDGQNKLKKQLNEDMDLPSTNAPEINTEYGWVNTDRAYSLADFKGKFVLLDFWTFGCINCQHIIPDLKRLEKEYKQELVVIGVHSAKFTGEKSTNTIKNAIAKFGIEHPVVNDADYKVWKNYAVNAWPTVVLISPDGKVVGQKSGEGVYAAVKPYLDKLIPKYKEKISNEVIKFNLQKEEAKTLRFPSKMISDPEGNIWIADSGNHRIVKITPEGKILEIIGSGKQGSEDGGFSEASFYEPHGLALKGSLLYIADTKNNKIKVADLFVKTVRNLAGDGTMGYYYFEENLNKPVNPNSPWDLLIVNEEMYIADAGNHQILRMDLKTNMVYRFAGTGREALADGNLRECAFNQPSGLAKIGNKIYVADAEASAIREIDLKENEVTTLLGKGLFDFGDMDGDVEKALLQHCVGLEARDGLIFITDTYNGKIKILNLIEKNVKTLVGGFNEPNDLLFLNNSIIISDTNNHRLIEFNLSDNSKSVIPVS